MKIAYVLGTFPNLTTTFVDREILEVQRSGVELVLISTHKPPPFEMSPEIKRLAAEIRYLQPTPWLTLASAHLNFVIKQPRTYLSTLLYLLTRPHPQVKDRFKTLFHFGLGVLTAGMLQHEGIEHLHAHFASAPTVVAMVASRLLRAPYSLFAHAYDIYASPVMLPEKIAGAKFVATCTTYSKAHLQNMNGGQFTGKVHLVYHGLDLSSIKASSPSSQNGQSSLLLSVGQLKEKKGFPHLIQACRILCNRGYYFRCEIIGEGPKRPELETLITDLNLQDTVILRGAMSHSDVMTRYAQATVFALACVLAENGDRDGIPNVLLEAMAMQVPVVSTRFSGIPEVIEDGATGLLIPPGDAEALANALARLLDEQDLRKKLGREGRKRVEERFDIKNNVGHLIELFKA